MNWWFVGGSVLAMFFLLLSKHSFYVVIGLIAFGLFAGFKYIMWRAKNE